MIRWSWNILNKNNISMMLNKCLIRWFWVDVTTKPLSDPELNASLPTRQTILERQVFFYVSLTNVGHLFNHLLWSIFQSLVIHNELLYTLKITKTLRRYQFSNGIWTLPSGDRTTFDHSNSGIVRYSDPHCIARINPRNVNSFLVRLDIS